MLLNSDSSYLHYRENDFNWLTNLCLFSCSLKSFQLCAPSLENLRLTNNYLQEIDLNWFPQLKYVCLSWNQLKKIEFGKESKLEVIHCQFNQLLQLDCNELSCLKELDCSSNFCRQTNQRLNLLNIDKCNNLKIVRANYNSLTFLFLSPWCAVEEIAVNFNHYEETIKGIMIIVFSPKLFSLSHEGTKVRGKCISYPTIKLLPRQESKQSLCCSQLKNKLLNKCLFNSQQSNDSLTMVRKKANPVNTKVKKINLDGNRLYSLKISKLTNFNESSEDKIVVSRVQLSNQWLLAITCWFSLLSAWLVIIHKSKITLIKENIFCFFGKCLNVFMSLLQLMSWFN